MKVEVGVVEMLHHKVIELGILWDIGDVPRGIGEGGECDDLRRNVIVFGFHLHVE